MNTSAGGYRKTNCVLLWSQRGIMRSHQLYHGTLPPAIKRWSRSRARVIGPRRHLRVLPTLTRPSLFGGD